MEESIIEDYLKTSEFGKNKMMSFIFQKLCEIKEELDGKALSLQQLADFEKRLNNSLSKNRFRENDYFNLILSYRYTQYEKENKTRLSARERTDIANELAKELGVEEKICRAPILIITPSDKIQPTDMRRFTECRHLTKLKYNLLFRMIGEKDKKTINAFKREFMKLKPLTKKGKIAMALSIASAVLGGAYLCCTYDTLYQCTKNARIYANEIDDYEARMDKYAEELKNMNLSDLELIMKIVDDMHSNIRGTGDPEIDAIGFYRLDVGNNNGVGICRNMADNTTYIVDRARPELHARNMMVILSKDCAIDMADIEINEIKGSEEGETNTGIFLANHEVTVFDVPGINCSLYVDTRNPSIGYVSGIKLKPFNEYRGTIEYDPFSEFVTSLLPNVEFVEDTKNMLKTNDIYNVEQLKEKWGKTAQNEALQKVRSIPGAKKMAKRAYASTLENLKKTDDVQTLSR